MKAIKTTGLLASVLLLANIAPTMAQQITYTESLRDNLKCARGVCEIETKGYYSAKIFISTSSLGQSNISVADIIDSSAHPDLILSIGNFNATLLGIDAISSNMTPHTFSTTWKNTHPDTNGHKRVDTVIKVTGNAKGITINITGANDGLEGLATEFGQYMFDDVCYDNGNGRELTTEANPNYVATVNINGDAFTADTYGTCHLHNKTVNKAGGSYDLKASRILHGDFASFTTLTID
jgi:hypothetical protein